MGEQSDQMSEGGEQDPLLSGGGDNHEQDYQAQYVSGEDTPPVTANANSSGPGATVIGYVNTLQMGESASPEELRDAYLANRSLSLQQIASESNFDDTDTDIEDDLSLKKSREFREKRVIVLSNLDARVLNSTAATLYRHNFHDHALGWLEFNNSFEKSITLQEVAEAEDERGRDIKSICIINTHCFERYVREIQSMSRNSRKRITEALKKNDRYVIILVDSVDLISRLKGAENDSEFYWVYWEIALLPHLVCSRLGYTSEAKSLAAKVREREGLDLYKHADVYSDLKQSLGQGFESFKRYVERDNHYADAEENILKKIVDGDPIDLVLYFFVCHFRYVGISDFRSIIARVLDGRKGKRIIKSESEPGNEVEDKPEGEVEDKPEGVTKGKKSQVDSEIEEYCLRKKWEEDADEIIASCYLKAVKNETGRRHLDFESPLHREKVRAYLDSSRAIMKLEIMTTLVDKCSYFFESLTPVGSDHYIDLLLDIAISEPERAFDWSGRMLAVFFNLMKDEAALSRRRKAIDDFYLKRVSDVFFRLYEKDELRRAVLHHLEILEDSVLSSRGDYRVSVYIRILDRLSEHDEFRVLSFIKPLIIGGESSSNLACQYMMKRFHRSPNEIFECFKTLRRWASGKNSTLALNAYSLTNYCIIKDLVKIKENEQPELGAWPPQDSFLLGFIGDNRSLLEERAGAFFEICTSQSAIEHKVPDGLFQLFLGPHLHLEIDKDYWYLYSLASSLTHWYVLVFGEEPSAEECEVEVRAEKECFFDEMLTILLGHLNQDQAILFERYIDLCAIRYLDLANGIDCSVEDSEFFISLSTVAYDLLNLFLEKQSQQLA